MGIYDKIKNVYSDGMDRFVVITVATDRNENLDRFEDSCKQNEIPYIILGLGDKWESGRAENGVLLEPGGAQKIIYLRDEIKGWYDLENTIILFSDSYDVIFNDSPEGIVNKFRKFNSPMVFSAEKTCWPNPDLENEYPEVDGDYRFLNSGGFIGYGDHILKMVDVEIEKSDDDQEYYTNYYLTDGTNPDIVLDHKQELFQTLNLAVDEVMVNYGKVLNTVTNTTPSVIHGNGSSHIKDKIEELYKDLYFNDKIDGYGFNLLFNVFLDFEVNDIDQVFDQIRYLNYPKNQIDIQIFFNDEKHDYKVSRFIDKFQGEYKTINKVFVGLNKANKREKSLFESMRYDVDYVVNFDANYIFRNRESIKYLIGENKNIISPMIVSEGTEWVNFWFRTDSDGYVVDNEYQKSIREYTEQGTFSVGYVTGIIMFKSSIIPNILGLYKRTDDDYEDDDFDVSFSKEVKRRGYQLWVTNKNYFGGVI